MKKANPTAPAPVATAEIPDHSISLLQFKEEYYAIADSLTTLWDIRIDSMSTVNSAYYIPSRSENEYKAIILQMRTLLERAGALIKNQIWPWD